MPPKSPQGLSQYIIYIALINTSSLRLVALRGLRTLRVHRVALQAPGVT